MDMVAALVEELAGGSAELSPAALPSRKSREAAPERTVPPEPCELTEKGVRLNEKSFRDGLTPFPRKHDGAAAPYPSAAALLFK